MRLRDLVLPAAFAAFGTMWGAWWSLVPDLVARYDLGTAALGGMLTVGFLLALPSMLANGRLVDRAGAGWGIAAAAAIMGGALLLVAASPDLVLLPLGIVLLASGSGAFDVAINAAAMADPRWSRASRLTLLHATFSAGGVVGALSGGLLAAGTPGFATAYLVVALVLLAVGLVASRSPWPAHPPDAIVPRALATAMLPVAAIVALGFLAGGTLEGWSALYLRDELGAAAFVGALGPATFHAAMLVGRVIGAVVAGSLGPVRTLAASGMALVAGMGIALPMDVAVPAIGGMGLAALGSAFLVPVAVSLASARAGPMAGRAASYVLTVGYGGLVIGPILVGGLAELAGLRAALTVVPVAGLLVLAVSRRAEFRR